jgi:hypothetical protein
MAMAVTCQAYLLFRSIHSAGCTPPFLNKNRNKGRIRENGLRCQYTVIALSYGKEA